MEYANFTFRRGWLKHLDDLTEWNNHTERLIEIARECEKQAGEGTYAALLFRSIRECLEDNLREHGRQGHLTLNLGTVRDGLTLCLHRQIQWTFGPDVLARIRP